MDIYADLKAATPGQLVRAALHHYRAREEFCRGIELGVKLCQPDGWQQVAPAWLRDVKQHEKLQE